MAHLCIEHPYEHAEGLCRKCGAPYCADCLIYPFGPAKPPYCVPCAVNAGGVRTTAGNPTRVMPKETKKRLKEWRKARKRDLDSPPPDGVATWQKMDEAAVEDAEEAAQVQADAEREALRLPPPVPETPTPPPGVNLAPPGPPGDDWRDEIDVSANFGPPGSSVAANEPLLGYAPPDDAPLPNLGPVPVPADESIGVDIGFSGPDRFEPTPLAGLGMGQPTHEARSPYDTGTSFGLDQAGHQPSAPLPSPTPEPAPFELPGFEPAAEPAPYEPTAAEPPPFQLPALDPEPTAAPVFAPPAAFDPPAFEPPVFEPEPAAFAPPAFEPTFPPEEAAFEPPAFPPEPGFAPDAFGPPAFEAPAFAPEPAGVAPVAFAPPAFEPMPFAPEPDAGTPITLESLNDPSFGAATPGEAGAPPAAGGAEPMATFGMGAEDSYVPPFVADPPPPPVAPSAPSVLDATPVGATLPPPSGAPAGGDLPVPSIRPPTPTRIPAANAEQAKGGDAKAMLARIAALRGDKD